jgi:hypothetical protein
LSGEQEPCSVGDVFRLDPDRFPAVNKVTLLFLKLATPLHKRHSAEQRDRQVLFHF